MPGRTFGPREHFPRLKEVFFFVAVFLTAMWKPM
jgi:hypothetical protein